MLLDRQVTFSEASVSSLLSPRLVVVITTIDTQGRVNAAPFAFCMPVSYVPVRIAFSSIRFKHFFMENVHFKGSGPEEGIPGLAQYAGETEHTLKDTLVNIAEQGEFGVSVLPYSYVHQMAITSSRYPFGVDELEIAGLTPYPSTKIKPPLIKEAKTAIECVRVYGHTFGTGFDQWTITVGEGVAAHVDPEVYDGKNFRFEKMSSIISNGNGIYGACNSFQEEPYILYPDVIPWPKQVS